MTPHQLRLRLLADALSLGDPDQVIKSLREKDVMYFDSDGTLLLTTAPEWSDERLAQAAVDVLLTGIDRWTNTCL